MRLPISFRNVTRSVCIPLSVPDPIITLIEAKPQSITTDLRQLKVEEFLRAKSLSKNSKRAYQHDLQKFMDWSKTTIWNDVSARQVGLFKEYLLEELKLAPTSVNRNLSTLKNFFTWMVNSEYMIKNPAKTISLETLVEPEAEDLSKDEVAQIYAAIAELSNPERNYALISILLHGLRASEVSALNLEDYDGRRLHIRKAKSDSKGYVPLVQEAIAHIDRYIQMRRDSSQDAYRRGDLLDKESPLFLSHSNRSLGTRLTYSGIHDIIASLKISTGINLHPHRFRHTFVTDLVLLGMDTHHIMTLSRHKSTQSFRRYTKRGDQVAAENAFYSIKREVSPLP